MCIQKKVLNNEKHLGLNFLIKLQQTKGFSAFSLMHTEARRRRRRVFFLFFFTYPVLSMQRSAHNIAFKTTFVLLIWK